MTSLSARLLGDAAAGDPHQRVQVFAGPDPEHRALAGTLIMRPDEAAAFLELVNGGGRPAAVSGEPVDEADLQDGELVRATTIGHWCTHIEQAPGFTHFSETSYERLPGGDRCPPNEGDRSRLAGLSAQVRGCVPADGPQDLPGPLADAAAIGTRVALAQRWPLALPETGDPRRIDLPSGSGQTVHLFVERVSTTPGSPADDMRRRWAER